MVHQRFEPRQSSPRSASHELRPRPLPDREPIFLPTPTAGFWSPPRSWHLPRPSPLAISEASSAARIPRWAGPRGGNELEEHEEALCWGGIPLKATAEVGRVGCGEEPREGARARDSGERAARWALLEPGQAGSRTLDLKNSALELALELGGVVPGSEPPAVSPHFPASGVGKPRSCPRSCCFPLRPHTLGKRPTVDPGGRCGPPSPVPRPPRAPRVPAGGTWVSPAARAQLWPRFAWPPLRLGLVPRAGLPCLPPPLAGGVSWFPFVLRLLVKPWASPGAPATSLHSSKIRGSSFLS